MSWPPNTWRWPGRATGGPYLLAGWSVGGVIAQQLAVMLRSAGEQVALLALFDSVPAEAAPSRRNGPGCWSGSRTTWPAWPAAGRCRRPAEPRRHRADGTGRGGGDAGPARAGRAHRGRAAPADPGALRGVRRAGWIVPAAPAAAGRRADRPAGRGRQPGRSGGGLETVRPRPACGHTRFPAATTRCCNRRTCTGCAAVFKRAARASPFERRRK